METGGAIKVLVAEDDPSVSELVSATLQGAGFSVLRARNGREALDLVDKARPDAFILDLGMPGVDGITVLKTLQKRPEDERPPTLVLTARHTTDDVRQCLSLGAKDYMAKPFDAERLIARVQRLLRKPLREPEPANPYKAATSAAYPTVRINIGKS